MKKKKTPKRPSAAPMTAAEAVVGTLIGHGLDTIYALPGFQNDFLFDTLFKVSDRLRTVHTRHEQGAAYMALGAALATGKPQAYAVVPGPGLLNSAAALLTAYSMNAPVLALVGQIPDADIGQGSAICTKSATRQGIIKRLVDHAAMIRSPQQASRATALALRAMRTGRPGPAALECAIDVWGKSAPVLLQSPLPPPASEDRHRCGPARSQAARRREASADYLRRWCSGCRRRSHGAVGHAASAGARLSARTRRARQPRPVERDAAAWP